MFLYRFFKSPKLKRSVDCSIAGLNAIVRSYGHNNIEVLAMQEFAHLKQDVYADAHKGNRDGRSISIREMDENGRGQVLYVKEFGKFFIGINETQSKWRRLWALFHELGHVAFDSIERPYSTPIGTLRRQEGDADTFALKQLTYSDEFFTKKEQNNLKAYWKFRRLHLRYYTKFDIGTGTLSKETNKKLKSAFQSIANKKASRK